MCTVAYAQEDRPNIVFIYTDDQAPWAASIAGNDQLMTPNIDRLGKEGAYLPNFFTPTPVCSPTRASLLTSRYGSEVGITDWINPSWPKTLKGTEPELGLDTAFVTWVELLKKSGYETGLIGKWHLGDNPEQHPSQYGYSQFVGFLGGGTVLKDPELEENGELKTFKGFTTNILTDQALEFISNHSKTESPFLLSLHYRAPHAPWLPLPEEDWHNYENLGVEFPHPYYPNLDKEKLRRFTREYYGSVASVDRNVGRILSLLDKIAIADNTMVVFTSDHGYNMGHNGIWHKGNGHWIVKNPPVATDNIPEGQRPNMYDNSIKVPTVVRWPAGIKAGTVIENSVNVLDWFPTLTAIGQLQLYDNLVVRGRNFLPLLVGGDVSDWSNDYYGEYSTHHQSRTHMRAYRNDEWKLVLDFMNLERNELYNLVDDPLETNNVYQDENNVDVVKALTDKIMQKMKEIGDPVLLTLDAEVTN